MKVYAGVDIGSTAIKVALVDGAGQLVDHVVTPTGSRFRSNAQEALQGLLTRCGLTDDDLAATAATGYGRKLLHQADRQISEITANALGAHRLGGDGQTIRTVINIGGQDLKVISLEEGGHVADFAMNDKCAAGTGRFLEMTARNLEVDVDELGALHAAAAGPPLTINSTCAVFAESEIIGLLASGHHRAGVAAGIHHSIARRVARLARSVLVQDVVIFDGGAALNTGLAAALEDELMRPVLVPPLPQVTTAIGAALAARDGNPA